MKVCHPQPSRMINVLSSASEKGSLDDISDKASQDGPNNKHPPSKAKMSYLLGAVKSNPGQTSRLPKVDLAKFQALRSHHHVTTRTKTSAAARTVKIAPESFLGKREVPIEDKASSSTVAIKRDSVQTKSGLTKDGSKPTTLSSSSGYSELSDEEQASSKPVVKVALKSLTGLLSPSPQLEQAGNQLLSRRKQQSHEAGSARRPEAPTSSLVRPAIQQLRASTDPPQAELSSKAVQQHNHRPQNDDQPQQGEVLSCIEAEDLPATPRIVSRTTAEDGRRQSAAADNNKATPDSFGRALHECFGVTRLETLTVSAVARNFAETHDADSSVFAPAEDLFAHSCQDSGVGAGSAVPGNSREEQKMEVFEGLPPNPKNSLVKQDANPAKTGMSSRKVGEYLKTVTEDFNMQQQLHSFSKTQTEATMEDLFGSQTQLLMGVLREGPGQLVAEHSDSLGRSLELVYGLSVEEFFSQLCLPKPRDILDILQTNNHDKPLLALYCTSITEFRKYQTKIAEYYGVNIKYMSTDELRLSVPCEESMDANLIQSSLSDHKAGSSLKASSKPTDSATSTRLGLTCIPEGTFNPEFFPEIEVFHAEDIKMESDPLAPLNSPAKIDPATGCSKPVRCREMVTGVETYLLDILSNLVKEQVDLAVTQNEHFFSPALLGQQSSVHPTLRAAIVDMMVALSRAKQLKDATFFMMVSIFDRYCWNSPWASLERKLTLTAWASYWIAAKVEEIYPMDFQEMTKTWVPGLATLSKLEEAEEDIIKTLSFKLSVPNLYTYWTLVSRISRLSKQARFYGLYLAHIVSKHGEMNFYHPLLQSLGILYLVCRILRGRWWNSDLLKTANKTFFEVKCCAKSLLYFLHKDRADEEFDEISQKFDTPWYMHISRIDVSKLTLDVF